MAKVNGNLITCNLSGPFGKQVVYSNRGGQAIAGKPPAVGKT
jgi:hypothetical protein